jgi:hypothetical protein
MSVVALMEELASRDIRLRSNGVQIAYDAPKGALTPELVQAIKASRQEILEVLPEKVNGVYHHKPKCICWLCAPGPRPGPRWKCRHGSIPNSCVTCRAVDEEEDPGG